MPDASFVSVEADIREPIEFLKELGGKEKTVMRHILSGVGTSAKNEAKRAYRPAGLSKRTGALYKSITRKVLKSGKGVIVEAKARSEKNIFYGYALSKGSTIKAKGDKHGDELHRGSCREVPHIEGVQGQARCACRA